MREFVGLAAFLMGLAVVVVVNVVIARLEAEIDVSVRDTLVGATSFIVKMVEKIKKQIISLDMRREDKPWRHYLGHEKDQ